MSATLDRLNRMLQSAAGPRHLRCSLCGRSAAEVARLVAGASVHICDACIAECVAGLEEHGGMPPAASKMQQ